MEWFWSHRVSLAQAARKAGWEIHVASFGAEQDARFAGSGFHPINLPSRITAAAPQNVLPCILALRGMFQRLRPRVIHAITLVHCLLTGLAAASVTGTRVVYTIAGLGYLFSSSGIKPRLLRAMLSPVMTEALRRADRVIFQNPHDRSILVNRKCVASDKTVVIPGSGVDVNLFRPRKNAPDPLPFILLPTRLLKEKGVFEFAEAARILKGRGVRARFVIAGGIDAINPRPVTREQMASLTNQGHVEWLGQVADMPELYARASFVVFPSYYREGVPKVLLEAAASGKAIITTDHPGCNDVVTHGETGLLVPIRDASALAEAIEELLTHPERCAAMGRRSKARAEAEFRVELINDGTLAQYIPSGEKDTVSPIEADRSTLPLASRVNLRTPDPIASELQGN